ncbi:MAG TPA: ATP-dependent DNA ligase [Candidatus Binatia bacterium]
MTVAAADGTLQRWSEVAEAIRATTRRLEKRTLLVDYLPRLDEASLPIAARFFSGVVFPRHDAGTTKVGGAILFQALAATSGEDLVKLGERYVEFGDAGDLAGAVLRDRAPSGATLVEVERLCRALAAARGTHARLALMREALGRLGGLEARYLVKLLGGELRIGLKEAQVEEALAAAFLRPLDAVRRANVLRGDIGEVALAARHDALAQATLALFHPIGFMLAQPLATAAEVAAALPVPFAVEDKYDGIRAQAHIGAERVVLFSRTLDAISHGYPEVVTALGVLPSGTVLDGELLAYDPDEPARALPFRALQQRLGRKRPSAELLASVPAAFVAYDLLAAEGALVVDEPYEARRRRLEALPWSGVTIRLAPSRLAGGADDVEAAFAAARAAGNEGVVAKDRGAPYTPGRRGGAWIKLKRPLATLDVVVVAVERGHGRRRAVLSDYTFAVRASESDPTLLTVGKAYNGLTDAEIAALTPRFEALTIERAGGWHRVQPEVVLEVTFDVVQPSGRHASGYALRFPRIVRVRDDKPPAEIDTVARVRALADHPPG